MKRAMVFHLCLAVAFALLSGGCTLKNQKQMAPVTFAVTIENISGESTLPTPLAPGVYAVHTEPYILYKGAQPDMGKGLEALAEDGMPGKLYAHLMTLVDVGAAGIFDTPSDMDKPGPLMPGASYVFEFLALPGDRLSFATMFVQSNDLFFGTIDWGLPLFRGDVPISGDYTPQVMLWDAGTELNEEPGKGKYQAPRQARPGLGGTEYGMVKLVKGAIPPTDQLIRVTVKNNRHSLQKLETMPGHGHGGHNN